ncbi:NADPH cytochrome P450 oxidoreductase isoenzyme 1 [Basidiobolus meristosporus CBS 931.73]|uniref:NADPH--cytochrome P450 reductase n=1 Tax=Basidiobolus meristosporus CBS 931.73 TaxID=1314790 RepID=A0A1Y1Y727_9FUNG|nr:NADPH cytochrome P450 oxidoreductase isoenzyme 1 [Basidiobolus meristosporus CBS 931.73]|eukprot:ORX93384.1 NADPH cytochrome P450 oxidoreductase isoenzyme 1 [Basidiobolus meristosporus CBS 931.73]
MITLSDMPKANIVSSTRKHPENFAKIMSELDKNAIFFFGSQTGTAEDFANRLMKEGEKRYGLRCMIADFDDYDFTVLDQLPSNKIAFFTVATYGEGEPSDNASKFFDFINQEEPPFSCGADPDGGNTPLKNLNYVIFGLGNSTYEFYNHAARTLDARLLKLGAHRIGERGEGDDDHSIEEDFLAWKDAMWSAVHATMMLDQINEEDAPVSPTYTITEYEETNTPETVHYGGLVEHGEVEKPISAKNPHFTSITSTRQLYNSTDRSCVHVEFDIGETNMAYETGDHLGIFPVNSDLEVTRLAEALGFQNGQLDRVVSIEIADTNSTKKCPFPSPTTYKSILRHHLDICTPPSRQLLSDLSSIAHNEPAKTYLKRLAENSEFYDLEIQQPCSSISRILELLEDIQRDIPEHERLKVPFSLLVEGLGKLQPRYYSISSSSSTYPSAVHVTAAVLQYTVAAPNPADNIRYGVTTNYLGSIHNYMNGVSIEGGRPTPKYYIHGVHDPKTGEIMSDNTQPNIKVPCFIRKSSFRLPKNPQSPVVLVGPGTGVAPFRAFVQERVYQVEQGGIVGPTMLFFGCRRREEDFLYGEEWESMFQRLPDSEMITAFSREQEDKIYVQHKLKENRQKIWKVLCDEGGYLYVCGDAKRMAKDIQSVLIEIAGEMGNLDTEQANNYVKHLRAEGRYQEDIWA